MVQSCRRFGDVVWGLTTPGQVGQSGDAMFKESSSRFLLIAFEWLALGAMWW
jgi:hypothetical protein